MRLLWCIHIEEKESRIFSFRMHNRPLAALFTLAQLTVAFVSFYQHIFSIYKYRHVFLCKSNIDYNTADWETKFLAYDIIIFDFGLMRRVLGTDECVANYLDGGYMRFGWCAQHIGALLLVLFGLFFMQKRLYILWPGLLIQSSYSLGLSVLTMATAPKMLEALGGYVNFHLATAFIIFVSGFTLNWLFTFILWHYYWYMERKREMEKDREADSQLIGEGVEAEFV